MIDHNKRINSCIFQLEIAVKMRGEEFAQEHPAIYKVARALCLAEGHNPDYVVMGNTYNFVPSIGAKSFIHLRTPFQAQWELYIKEAKVAVDTLTTNEKRPYDPEGILT